MIKQLVTAAVLFSSSLVHAYSVSTIDGNLRDISSTGTQLNLSDDQLSNPINLGFDFDFYGVSQNSVRVSSNGFMTFDPTVFGSGCCSGRQLPYADQYNGVFAGLWADLDSNSNTTGTMFYETRGNAGAREFIFGFYNVNHWPSGSPVTFEMILHEASNHLEVQFGSLSTSYGTHTIGIENYDGTEGIEFYRGRDYAQFAQTGVLFEAADVPEPGTFWLVGAAMLGLVGRHRKKHFA